MYIRLEHEHETRIKVVDIACEKLKRLSQAGRAFLTVSFDTSSKLPLASGKFRLQCIVQNPDMAVYGTMTSSLEEHTNTVVTCHSSIAIMEMKLHYWFVLHGENNTICHTLIRDMVRPSGANYTDGEDEER